MVTTTQISRQETASKLNPSSPDYENKKLIIKKLVPNKELVNKEVRKEIKTGYLSW